MPMLDEDDRKKIRFLASMSVHDRRTTDMDEATIRREVLAFGARAFNRHIDGQAEQESWLAEFGRQVDRAIEETRVRWVSEPGVPA